MGGRGRHFVCSQLSFSEFQTFRPWSYLYRHRNDFISLPTSCRVTEVGCSILVFNVWEAVVAFASVSEAVGFSETISPGRWRKKWDYLVLNTSIYWLERYLHTSTAARTSPSLSDILPRGVIVLQLSLKLSACLFLRWCYAVAVKCFVFIMAHRDLRDFKKCSVFGQPMASNSTPNNSFVYE